MRTVLVALEIAHVVAHRQPGRRLVVAHALQALQEAARHAQQALLALQCGSAV